jgi:uncharacterized protein YqgV (UPF0045/DUF77 family)
VEEKQVIQAMVAVYPIGQGDYTAVQRAIEQLRARNVSPEVQPMHTQIAGEESDVFAALQAAFAAASTTGAVVMTVTITNACPVGTRAAPG